MISPSYHTEHGPIRNEQLTTLNRALSDEIQRHARTRLALLQLLQFCWIKEDLPPAEIERKTIVRRIEFDVVEVHEPVKRRPLINAELAERHADILKAIPARLMLRSGAVLDSSNKSANLDGAVALFRDSSWLALCLMVSRGREFVGRDELRDLILGSQGAYSSVRAAVGRARAVLAAVGADNDIEAASVHGGGWRLRFAREALP